MQRLDQYVAEMLNISRNQASDKIKAGLVMVNQVVKTKNAYQVSDEDRIEVKASELDFASRGAGKLYYALLEYQIDLNNKICVDIGASSGGFSDVCLKMNAKKVYAIDAGSNQLIERLRKDPRIVCWENCNARYLKKEQFQDSIDFICMDVSFISAKLILPIIFSLMDEVNAVILVKPQFEAGKALIGKKGIIKDHKVHQMVLKDMVSFVLSHGYYVAHISASQVEGRHGNQEFLMHITSKKYPSNFDYAKIVKSKR